MIFHFFPPHFNFLFASNYVECVYMKYHMPIDCNSSCRFSTIQMDLYRCYLGRKMSICFCQDSKMSFLLLMHFNLDIFSVLNTMKLYS